MAKLTAKAVQHAGDGVHFDGEGLYLRVGKNGAHRQWVLRYTFDGKRRDTGLGSARDVSLADARREARRLRDLAKAGTDPREARKPDAAHPVREAAPEAPAAAPAGLTFAEAVEAFLPTRLHGLKNDKHRAQWGSTLQTYAVAPEGVKGLGDMVVADITAEDVRRVLAPIWTTKAETATRVRARIEAVLSWAKVAGHRTGENPAAWKENLEHLLGKAVKRKRHHPAMPWADVPAFWEALDAREGVSARCLQWLILTAVRSGEARGATWGEVDLDRGLWTIPAARMKAKEPHVVPLPPQALAIAHRVRGLDSDLIFPSPVRTKDGAARPLDYNAFQALFDRMGIKDITAHGFRSSFRMWCSDQAEAPRELAEAALAHRIGSAVELAYARSRMTERRRPLMEAWADFITGEMVKSPE